jgi:2-polyprenyl-6-hydroxyphenyl methylase/3-demethylubiquinone-9 3-methyltransferase
MKTPSRWQFAQMLEIRWWKNYLKKKEVGDYLEWKKNYWNTFLLSIPSDLLSPGQLVLDAGCGPAGIFIVLPQHQVIGVDPLIDQYRQHLPHFRPDLSPWTEFYSTPLESFVYPKTFDLIFSLNAFNHFKDLTVSLQVLDKVLKPGGHCILTLDTHRHAWMKFILSRIPADALHPHQYNQQEYIQKILEVNPHWKLVFEKTLKQEQIFNYDLLIWKKEN